MDSFAVAYPLARLAAYFGTFLVLGGAVFRLAVIRSWLASHPDDAPVAAVLAVRAVRLGLLGGVLLLVASAVRLWFQLASFTEPGEAVTWELVRLLVGETPWGRGWMAQVGAAVLALGGYLLAVAAPRAGWVAAALGATAVALTAPLTGHAVSAAAGRTGVAIDALHVLGASAWLGTLAVTVVAGLAALGRLGPDQRGPLVARLIAAFSPVALVGASVAVVAGGILGWRYLGGSLGALLGTAYGQALCVKLGVLAAVAGFGAWNWRVHLPRLGSAEAADRLGRSARTEVVLGIILLAVTAVLVALPMPAESYDDSSDPETAMNLEIAP